MAMFKQTRLEFLDEEHLETLWEGFPKKLRHEVTQHYARLMAHTSVQRIRALRKKREAGDEPNDG